MHLDWLRHLLHFLSLQMRSAQVSERLPFRFLGGDGMPLGCRARVCGPSHHSPLHGGAAEDVRGDWVVRETFQLWKGCAARAYFGTPAQKPKRASAFGEWTATARIAVYSRDVDV